MTGNTNPPLDSSTQSSLPSSTDLYLSSTATSHRHMRENSQDAPVYDSMISSAQWSIMSESGIVQRQHSNDSSQHEDALFRSTATFSLTSSMFSMQDALGEEHSPVSSPLSSPSSVTSASSHQHAFKVPEHAENASASTMPALHVSTTTSPKSTSLSPNTSPATSPLPRSNTSSPLLGDKILPSLLTDKLKFELPSTYYISTPPHVGASETGNVTDKVPTHILFNPLIQNGILEHAVIRRSTDDFVVHVVVQNLTSWIDLQEFTFARFFNGSVPKERKEYDVILNGKKYSAFKVHRKHVLTDCIQLSPALIITFQAKIMTQTEWDDYHMVMNALRIPYCSNPFPAPGKLRICATLNDSSGQSVEMDLPSVYCTTYEEGVAPSPKKYTESVYMAKNRIFEVFAPMILTGKERPAPTNCGFALYSVYSEDQHKFIAKYRNEHAPAPEKIDLNFQAGPDMICRVFRYKSEEHQFLDCIFQHPAMKRNVLILSIYVDKSVRTTNSANAYFTRVMDCIKSLNFTTSFMKGVPSTFLYTSDAYKFSMMLPSDSLITENPVPSAVDCIVSISSQMVFTSPYVKKEHTALCTTLITKYNREVPEEEEPDPERLAKLKMKELLKVCKSDQVECELLNDEWTTRFNYQDQVKFVVGTYVFYNAAEIYLFQTEIRGHSSDILKRQVTCFHNTIRFTE